MNRFLLYFCLFYVWFVHCSALHLQNLCEQDHFVYDNILVNAVYSVKKELPLGEVKKFAIVSVDNCNGSVMDSLVNTVLDIKKKQ